MCNQNNALSFCQFKLSFHHQILIASKILIPDKFLPPNSGDSPEGTETDQYCLRIVPQPCSDPETHLIY